MCLSHNIENCADDIFCDLTNYCLWKTGGKYVNLVSPYTYPLHCMMSCRVLADAQGPQMHQTISRGAWEDGASGKTLLLGPNLLEVLVLCFASVLESCICVYRNYLHLWTELNASRNLCLLSWSIALIRASIFSVMQVYKCCFPRLLVSTSLQYIEFLKYLL